MPWSTRATSTVSSARVVEPPKTSAVSIAASPVDLETSPGIIMRGLPVMIEVDRREAMIPPRCLSPARNRIAADAARTAPVEGYSSAGDLWRMSTASRVTTAPVVAPMARGCRQHNRLGLSMPVPQASDGEPAQLARYRRDLGDVPQFCVSFTSSNIWLYFCRSAW